MDQSIQKNATGIKNIKTILTKYPFPAFVWYLILQTALARCAYFIVMPFIAIKMQEIPNTSATEIGAVLGIGPLVGTMAGFYIGYLSDLFGRRKILLFALILWILIFIGFAHAQTSLQFAFLMIFNGLARAAYEPVATALSSDLCKKEDQSGELLKKAFHIRYLLINLGAAIAPPLGAFFYLYHPKLGFYSTSSVYLISAISFVYFAKKLKLKATELMIEKSTHTFKQTILVLTRDKLLRLYLLAFFLLSLAFAQIDFSLIIHLKQLYQENGVKLFATLLTINGALIVLITLPLLEWSKKINIHLMCTISCLFWAAGYFSFAFATSPIFYYIGIIFITLGEIIVFANSNYLIEKIAPEKMKGAYLSTLNLGFAGVIIGPLLGGIVMDLFGSSTLFLICTILMILSAKIYLNIKKLVSV